MRVLAGAAKDQGRQAYAQNLRNCVRWIVEGRQDEWSEAYYSDCKLMKPNGVKNEFLFEHHEF